MTQIAPFMSLLDRLVSCRSTHEYPEGKKQAIEVVRSYLSDSGITSELFSDGGYDSLLAYVGQRRPQKFSVLINAHIDVVSGTLDQFKLTSVGDTLYGRGVYDMKGATAVLISAFCAEAPSLSYPLGLQIVSDEEVGGHHGTKYQISQGISADFVVSGEPTDMAINHLSKGIVWVRLRVRGTSAHAAYPWLGKNPISVLMSVCRRIQRLYPTPRREVWRSTITVSECMSCGGGVNSIPEEASAFLDIRYLPGEDASILQKIHESTAGMCDVEIVLHEPAHMTRKDSKYIQTLQSVGLEMSGKRYPLVKKHGSSDVRFYSALGTSAITFGPVGGGAHAHDEWVSHDSLFAYKEAMNRFLRTLSEK